jgi:undecaprenyl-diphosphatase
LAASVSGFGARQTSRRIGDFDDAADLYLDRVRGSRLADRVMYGASELGDHGLVWMMLGAASGLRGGRHERSALRLLALMPVESAIVNGGIKSLFRRTRPVSSAPRPLPLRVPLTSSFPSGHASSAFFAATLLAEDDPALAPLLFAMAAVIAASRPYVRIHHASDVIAGAFIGTALAMLARRLVPLEPSAPAG